MKREEGCIVDGHCSCATFSYVALAVFVLFWHQCFSLYLYPANFHVLVVMEAACCCLVSAQRKPLGATSTCALRDQQWNRHSRCHVICEPPPLPKLGIFLVEADNVPAMIWLSSCSGSSTRLSRMWRSSLMRHSARRHALARLFASTCVRC